MLISMRLPLIVCSFLTLALMISPNLSAAHGNAKVTPYNWNNNYTLILTDAQNITEAYAAADAIQKVGGHVGVIIPNRVMLGWLPAGAGKGLVGKYKIRQVVQRPIKDVSEVVKRFAGDQEDAADAIAFFNQVASGAWKANKARLREYEEAKAAENEVEMLPDALPTPPVSYADLMANLEANGLNEDKLKAAGITLTTPSRGAAALSPGNSDYMVGKVLFNAIFVESNGLIDPNLYTWTATDRTLIRNEITAGLSWWANTAQSTYGTPLTFVLSTFYGTNTQTSYEPIRRSSSQDYLWINQIMANLGYATGDKFARCTAFNTARRVAMKTNWSVVSFIAYNPYPAPTNFTDGYFAYAYVRGPYSQLLFRNNGWATSQYDIVNAHETGHLFGAPDEYYQAGYGGCTSCGPSTNGVLNANCQYCNTNYVPCMMRGNTMALCGYTPGHLGWQAPQAVSAYTAMTNYVGNEFFAAGQPIQFKCYYCVAGPVWSGLPKLDLKIRFRAEYMAGTVDAPSSLYDDTGWFTGADWVTPPTTTGLNCWIVSWNRTVPAGAFGPASLSAELSVEKYGKAIASDTTRFFVTPNANPSSAPPAGSVEKVVADVNEGPVIKPAPAP